MSFKTLASLTDDPFLLLRSPQSKCFINTLHDFPLQLNQAVVQSTESRVPHSVLYIISYDYIIIRFYQQIL